MSKEIFIKKIRKPLKGIDHVVIGIEWRIILK
jgi:hypothetical protein